MGRGENEGDRSGPVRASDPAAAAATWALYGRHAELFAAGGPRPAIHRSAGTFAAFAGAPHGELNQAAIFGPAQADEVRALVACVAGSRLPALVGRSLGAPEERVAPLVAAGFRRLPDRELLFAAEELPPVRPSPFAIRAIRTAADVAALRPIAHEIHGYAPELSDAFLGWRAVAGDPLSGWLAWDGPEAIAAAFVTRLGRTLGLWNVMTAGAHQGRKAGSAVVRTALREAEAAGSEPIERIVFWASPAGGPFYASLGFRGIDTLEAWVLDAPD